MAFNHSVVAYPDRGHWGSNKYRGNCTGHIVKDFFESFHKTGRLAADPSIGGGTSVEVAKELGINFIGTDLHQGFNLLKDDFGSFLKQEANTVWWHPPYWDMIEYSNNMWGTQPDPWDMSRMPLDDFVEALELALMNINDAVETNGHYGVLMGNLRREGRYYNLSSLVERVAPGMLVDEVIKMQYNCVSDNREYSGKLIRIAHEKLLIFRKKGGSLMLLGAAIQRASNMVNTTWKAAIRRVLQREGTLSLAQLYERIEPFAKAKENEHWQAKVRQVVQDEKLFKRVDKGVYCLA